MVFNFRFTIRLLANPGGRLQDTSHPVDTELIKVHQKFTLQMSHLHDHLNEAS